MTSRDTRRRPAGPLVAVGFAVVGAALAAAAATLTWTTDERPDALAGPVQVSGSELVGELVPVALVALAGVGATFATGGWARRVVGLLIAAAGALIAARSATAWATADAAVTVQPLGPALGVLGGLAILAAGWLIAAGRGGRRLGARYDRPAGAGGQRAGSGDVDLWRALDAGTDPTTDGPVEPAGGPPEDAARRQAHEGPSRVSDQTPAAGYDDRVARPGEPPVTRTRHDRPESPPRATSRENRSDADREASG